MNYYLTLDDAEFRYIYKDIMISQPKQDLHNKSLSHQDQDKREGGLQTRINFWLNYVVSQGSPIPDNVYESDYNNKDGRAYFF